jgi:hypothetical protein
MKETQIVEGDHADKNHAKWKNLLCDLNVELKRRHKRLSA